MNHHSQTAMERTALAVVAICLVAVGLSLLDAVNKPITSDATSDMTSDIVSDVIPEVPSDRVRLRPVWSDTPSRPFNVQQLSPRLEISDLGTVPAQHHRFEEEILIQDALELQRQMFEEFNIQPVFTID